MTDDLFAEYTFGKLALQKIASADPGFRLYLAGWTGPVNQREVMEVKGAVFREPLRGPNKGKLSIMVPNTSRTVKVTATEMAAFEKALAVPVQPGLAKGLES